jgi:hypothetical protein
VCATCDYTNNYYLVNNTCQYCNSSNNMFINSSDPTYPCVPCNIAHCLTCLSLTQCSICDNANGYFLKKLDKQCYLCSSTVTNCMTCSAYGVCQTCNYANNYYLYNSACILCNQVNKFINTTDVTYPCVVCSPTNCITCSSINSCSSCDTANGY